MTVEVLPHDPLDVQLLRRPDVSHAFQQFVEWYAAYGYVVLFLGVLLENAGVPVPGETAVLVAGFLASPAGRARFQLAWVIVLACAAAILGDNLAYWLARRLARPRLQRGRAFLFLTPERLQAAQGYFERYGTWTVFSARFITGLRVVVALAAGALGMSWPQFFRANAAGAVAWSVAISLLGYYFGRSWKTLHHWLGWGAWVVLACVVVVVVAWHLWHQPSKQP